MTIRIPSLVRVVLVLLLLAGCAVVATPADVVILKDGFVIQGNALQDRMYVLDKASGRNIEIVKRSGLEMLDQGPSVIVFSEHARQPGAVSPDTKIRPDVHAYTMPRLKSRGWDPVPPISAKTTISEFDAKWKRTFRVITPEGLHIIEQQITHIDPFYVRLFSPTHTWHVTYRTSEWDPALIRKLLVKHPELAEPDGKCNPDKRLMLAKFMLDAGWLKLAKDEIERMKREFTGEMGKETKEKHDKLQKEIDEATAELVVHEAELALPAARYEYTKELLPAFPEKLATVQQKTRIAKVTAEFKTSMERYETSRRLLRNLIGDTTGQKIKNATVAIGGGLGSLGWQTPKDSTPVMLELAAAAEQVYSELHPDSASRIELFVTLAIQDENQQKAGTERTTKPEQLLARAVSSWARGKNGSTGNAEDAMKIWKARELVLAYQREESVNNRRAMLNRFKQTPMMSVEEIAQMVLMLPPADPEDLNNRTGKPVQIRDKDAGVYRRTTLPAPGQPNGLDYLVRLPSEYHHGRAYPVLIVLTHERIDPAEVIPALINDADKNGYILVVPEWTGEFAKRGGWEWKGEDHVWVTAALRDAVRHFTVDNDRVFMVGVGDGANMALDVGMSHPDLFAGVVAMGPIPKWRGYFDNLWGNAQKLPVFVVTGENIGDGMQSLRSMYDQWTRRGYPSLWSIYRGRGVEWYAAEVPTLFDWMNRKRRASSAAVLKLDNAVAERMPWKMMHATSTGVDNRFYWLQADSAWIGKNGGAPVPATIQGDIQGNAVKVSCFHVKHVTVWLGFDMIDWTQPVSVTVNNGLPPKYPRGGKKIGPDLEILLEDYYQRGDRRMLFLNKLEFDVLGS